jgi:hypothetical protein
MVFPGLERRKGWIGLSFANQPVIPRHGLPLSFDHPGSGGGIVSYPLELFGALAAVLVVVIPSALLWNTSSRASHGGLITGADNRISTSKTIALAWTMIVAWMVVADAFIAAFPSKPPDTFSDMLSKASDLYFVFLGGPFAAAAFAKASVQTKMAQGKLTKTPADTAMSSDLISDDNGNPDLYDFQYVLFNVLALLIVAVIFWVHPVMGPPTVPDFLAILTGGSALTYTVNKAIATDTPQINSVTPANARIGDVITITGVQMFSTTAGGAFPSVTIGGIGATGVTIPTGSTTTLMATVADAPSGMSLGGTKDVVVSPPLASPITARNAITIVADKPAITKVAEQPVKAGDLITVTGSLMLTPGTQPGTAAKNTTSVGGLTPALTVSDTSWSVTCESAYSDSEISLRIGDPPAGLGGPGDATLTLTRGTEQASKPIKYEVAPAITSAASVAATIGSEFSFRVTATGFPAPKITTSGTLPGGVTFDAATATFSGTPGAGTAGSYTISITAANIVDLVVQNFDLTVS